MKEINYLEIDQYHAGELKGDILVAFEKRLISDKEFAETVNLYREINHTLSSRMSNYKQENDLRNTLEDLSKNQKFKIKHQESSSEKQESKVFSLKKYGKLMIAASLVLFASLLLFQNGNPSYKDFSNHENADFIMRGDSVSGFEKAQEAFNNHNYVVAENEFKKLNKIAGDNTKDELKFYLAICLMEQDKFEFAESIFIKLKDGNSIYKTKAIWYLALCKLKQKDYENATHFADLVPKTAEDYEIAQKLLKEL